MGANRRQCHDWQLIVAGPDSEKGIVRAIRPSLVSYGSTNPQQNLTLTLALHDRTDAVIASNDN
jgi:hypothetical protein